MKSFTSVEATLMASVSLPYPLQSLGYSFSAVLKPKVCTIRTSHKMFTRLRRTFQELLKLNSLLTLCFKLSMDGAVQPRHGPSIHTREGRWTFRLCAVGKPETANGFPPTN